MYIVMVLTVSIQVRLAFPLSSYFLSSLLIALVEGVLFGL